MMKIKKIKDYTRMNRNLTYINFCYMVLGIIGSLITDKDTWFILLFMLGLINIYHISNEENFLTLFDRINSEDG